MGRAFENPRADPCQVGESQMTEIKLIIEGALFSNPDFILGSCVTLYREDGRSLWKQRFLVCGKGKDLDADSTVYHLHPVEETFGGKVHEYDESSRD